MSFSQKVIRWVLSAIFFCDGGYGIVSGHIFARTRGGDHSGIIEGPAARVLGIVFVGIAVTGVGRHSKEKRLTRRQSQRPQAAVAQLER